MKSLNLIFILVAGIAVVKADTTTEDPLRQLINAIDSGAKKFEEVTGIQTDFDRNKLENYLKNSFEKSGEKLQELLKSFGKENNGDLKAHLENIVKQLNETVKNINTPDVQGKIKNVQESLEASFKKLGEHFKEIAKSAGVTTSPEFQKKLNEFYEELGKGSKQISEKVQQIAAKAQEEFKKKSSS